MPFLFSIDDVFVSCFHAGDGGNDVSMIQAANAGVGLVGKVSKKWLNVFQNNDSQSTDNTVSKHSDSILLCSSVLGCSIMSKRPVPCLCYNCLGE